MSQRTTRLAGDKGCRADGVGEYLLALDITPVIPSKTNELRSVRSVEFDKQAYLNIVERLIGCLKECRRAFSRYEKMTKKFAGMVCMALIQRYL